MTIISKWDTGRGGIIEIYQCGDKLCGKLVHSQELERLDDKNPDESKRTKTLIGSDILKNFQPKGDDTWEDGEIYDPTSGKSYSAKLTLKGNVLKVRGFVGVAILGKTVEWKRV